MRRGADPAVRARGALAVLAAVAVAAFASVAAAPAPAARTGCGNPRMAPREQRAVLHALASGRDVWGEQLLAARDGPTYAAAAQYLPPLLFARGPHGTKLTASGVYYVPVADPPGPAGAGVVALHVADGSELLARKVTGRSLTLLVGADGRERYGSCLSRLTPARLLDGYLPVLETSYVDAHGARYDEESFATHSGGELTSYVQLHAGARSSTSDALLRFAPSHVDVRVPRGRERTVRLAWRSGEPQLVDASAYEAARRDLVRRWNTRLGQGMQVSVPERRVADAERALLVQNLLLGWRYSIGNPYEEFSFPEGPAVAEVMGEYGFPDVERAVLDASLARSSTGYANWKRGERLLVSAADFRLFRDRAYIDRATPKLAAFVAALRSSLRREAPSILEPERYSSDIPDRVYGLHAQTVAWAGLRAIGSLWAADRPRSARAQAGALAERLERPCGPQSTGPAPVARRLALRAGAAARPRDAVPFARRSAARELLESRHAVRARVRLLPARRHRGAGVFRYMLLHGSRLLGLVRAGAYALYGRTAPFPMSGTDQVYGNAVSRFLADNGRADQLVLSLYGQLAAGMTPGTFVAGEAAGVAPLDGRRTARCTCRRTTPRTPPSSRRSARCSCTRPPTTLELAYSTPRAWLEPGKRIAVAGAPTGFGPVSFSIAVHAGSARVRVDPPVRAVPKRLTMRLRLPHGERIAGVVPATPYDGATGTIDVSGRRGPVELDVRLTR